MIKDLDKKRYIMYKRKIVVLYCRILRNCPHHDKDNSIVNQKIPLRAAAQHGFEYICLDSLSDKNP